MFQELGKVGLIYGSDTGATEDVTRLFESFIGEDLEIIEVSEAEVEDFKRFDVLILGISTWYDGDLQSDWEDYFETFKTIDFTDQVVALFGLGDQHGYAEYFIDGVGYLAEVVLANGGTIIGEWPTQDYEHAESKAEKNDDMFYGLALDEDNEPILTEDRILVWLDQLKGEYQNLHIAQG
ncbi:MAG: flavodoxin [Crocinitomicaceae bacterium]|nr:flavodoxin [Crocinitomicaceae bacterium]